MDTRTDTGLVGVGIYTVPQASLLADVPARAIRRWVFGYKYKHEGRSVEQPSVVQVDFGAVAREHRVLSFQDLIEIKFIHAFRTEGVSWHTIRRAAARARELTHSDHPFASRKFVTDGRTIFAEIASSIEATELLDLKQNQMAFRRILLPSLRARLDIGPLGAERWWPLGKKRPVVIDPARQFGQPISSREGVPTAVLAAGVRTTQSVDQISRWYDVAISAVRAAVEFERRLHEHSLAA